MKKILFILLTTLSISAYAEYGKTWADLLSELMTGKITSSSGTTDVNTLFTTNTIKPKWCKNKLKKSEQIVCSSEDLWSLEKENTDLYASLYNTKKQIKGNKKELDAWLDYRDVKCGSIETCIELYRKRIVVLKQRKSIKEDNYERQSHGKSVDDNMPNWCGNKLNQSERFICKHKNIWIFDSTLNDLHDQTTEKQKTSLQMKKWREDERNKKCIISVNDCIKTYHEKIFHIYYLIYSFSVISTHAVNRTT